MLIFLGLQRGVKNYLLLIKGDFFYADEWLLPDMHFEDWDCELDHPYHQFDCVTYTEDPADFSVSLGDWMTHIGSLKTGI